MKQILLVGLGGFLGSIARYQLGQWIQPLGTHGRFPMATFAVNVVGCLAAGLLAGAVDKYDLFSPPVRLFLFFGLLGGFTTFSAFGLETVQLLRRGEWAVAAGYAICSVLLGVAAAWLGFKLVEAFSN